VAIGRSSFFVAALADGIGQKTKIVSKAFVLESFHLGCWSACHLPEFCSSITENTKYIAVVNSQLGPGVYVLVTPDKFK
jgi:hypothetical protein